MKVGTWFRDAVIVGGCFISLSALTQSAVASTLDFESVGVAGSQAAISDGYGGLTWDNFFVLNGEDKYSDKPGNGFINGTASGDYVAFNGFAKPAAVELAGGYFDFVGAAFTAAWNDGLKVDIAGFRDGTEVYSQTVTLDTEFYANLFFNWLKIDQLTFKTYGGTQIGYGSGHQMVIDNFQYNVVTTPIPPAFLLMATALVGLGVAGWRRRKLPALTSA